MAKDVNIRGALTFDNEQDLAQALKQAEQFLVEHADKLLSIDDLTPLGLHLPVNTHVQGNDEAIKNGKALIYSLAAAAYSGHIDVSVDGTQERFNAREIEPKQIQLSDISD